MTAVIKVNIRVYGQVQGVFFRRSTKDEADKLGLVGWVRNNADGSVEILAVGPRDKLDKFVTWCREGPPLAQVERVEIDWFKESDDFEGFSIL